MSRLCHKLRAKYRGYSMRFISEEQPVNQRLDERFISLTRQVEGSPKQPATLDPMAGTPPSAHDTRKPIDLPALMGAVSSCGPADSAGYRWGLLFGRAGSGKTSTCRYLAQLWAAADHTWMHDHGFDLVVLVELAMLHKPGKISDAVDLFAAALKNDVPASSMEGLYHGLPKTGAKVLWLLDGLDELPRDSALAKLVGSGRLGDQPVFKHCLVASRPEAAQWPQGMETRAELLGFTEDGKRQYISSYMGQDKQAQADNLIQALRDNNAAVWSACSIPLLLELVCIGSQELLQQLQADSTVLHMRQLLQPSQLYRRAVDKMLDYAERKPGKADKFSKAKALQGLHKLARIGWAQEARVVKPESLVASGQLAQEQATHALASGLLRSGGAGGKEVWFVHYSVQEYLVADGLAAELLEADGDCSQCFEDVRCSRDELVWPLLAGLLWRAEEELGAGKVTEQWTAFWQALNSKHPIHETPGFMLDAINHSQLLLAICIECGGFGALCGRAAGHDLPAATPLLQRQAKSALLGSVESYQPCQPPALHRAHLQVPC